MKFVADRIFAQKIGTTAMKTHGNSCRNYRDTNKRNLDRNHLDHPLPKQSISPQRLPPTRARGIKIRPLPQAHRPIPLPLAQTLLEDIIRRSSMIHTPIIPNRNIILRLPLQPHLQIMILNDKLHEPTQEVLALVIRQPMNPLDMMSHRKNRLPPRHRVRAAYR